MTKFYVRCVYDYELYLQEEFDTEDQLHAFLDEFMEQNPKAVVEVFLGTKLEVKPTEVKTRWRVKTR